ncbi:MAG: stage V sporulation protein AC [Clostridiales bacterium]|jgi:stage V sporulation protein AC|nr:stage V sporulation protein AC [Clostridiales bacterium]
MVNKLSEKYKKLVDKISPDSKIYLNCFNAFWTGGLICTLGQFITNFFLNKNIELEQACTWTSIILIFIAVVLTGFGFFDKIAKFAGAGTAIPITGFANSIASPAIEFKSEGYIFGVGAKIFIIAGPVIAYSIFCSIIYGLIYYFFIK